jgi:signal transduction histidine kinase/ligand-binding sensor domain-containing protein/ActR/RegA family two-component response regulator
MVLGLLAPAILLAGARAVAEEPPMVFTHLSTDQGLSQESVNDVLQDSQGFIWLATENGLNRYDGTEVRRYYRERHTSDGLASDYISALDEDQAGNIWLATEGSGLVVWNRRTDSFTSYRHTPGDGRSLASDSIYDVMVDSRGRVWAATRDAGLDRLDPTSGTITHFVHHGSRRGSLSSNQHLYALLEDRDGAVWVSTREGLDRFLGDGKGFEHFTPPVVLGGMHKILAITQDSRGDLWLASFDAGLQRLDPATGRFTSHAHGENRQGSLSDNDVRTVFEDSAGRLWVGTANGLNLFDRHTGTFQVYRRDRANPRSLTDSFVTAIMEDRNGLLWIGTKSGGASRWNPRSWSLGHRRPDWLSDDPSMVNAFADAPDGGLWVGTMGAGLLHVQAGTGRVIPAPKGQAFSDSRVMSLLNDRAGSLWVGTMNSGLTRLGADGSRETFRTGNDGQSGLGSDGIMSLYEDQSGRIWIGTFEGGVSVWEPETGTLRRYTDTTGRSAWLDRVRATAIREDRKGRIWVATDGEGLLVLDPRRGLLHQFKNQPDKAGSLASNSVFALHLDGAGTLWIGTGGGGLDHVVDMSASLPEVRFSNLSQADGLANDVIYDIETDGAGKLWLPSNNGLMRFDPLTGEIRIFHASHGAQGEEFSFGASFRSASGRLLFAGNEGYNDFDPRGLEESAVAPPVVLTSIDVQHRPLESAVAIPLVSSLELGHRENALSLTFAALDFTDPARNQYAYQLEGFDADWVKLSNERRVTYTNLAAGHYVFRVKAASADSVWNENGLRLAVTVKPAPWRTGWAYAAYAALAVLLLLMTHRYQTRRLRAEQQYARRLASEVEARTEELNQRNVALAEASAAKSNFLARMSHEIRTPMNGVMGMTELLSSTDLSVQQRHYTQTISRSAQALLQIINDILDLSKVEAGKLELEAQPFDIEQLVDDCIAMLAPQANKKGVELVVALDPGLPRLFVGDAVRIRQILTNLLGNALKFTAEGEVLVRAGTRQVSGGRAIVRLEVADTGIGMDEAVLARVFDPFSQADESTTRRFGGTGLGLSICRQLVELMGGSIGVTSQPSVGSTFWCEIPLVVGDETPLADPTSPLAGLRIVVATPARSLQEGIALRLLAEGAGTIPVDSSADLERVLAGHTDHDVLILDADRLTRPGQQLPNLPEPGDARVVRVVLSRQAGVLAGGNPARARDVWLAKPVSLRGLRQSILATLARSGPPAAPAPVAAGARRVEPAGLPGRILVVEDNPVNQLVAEGMLASLGYEATPVADGRSALARLSTEHFDLVLMDCQMPGMDGFEATRGLRAATQGKWRIPVIGLTAHASAEAREACLEAGMDDFMSKPYTLDELRAMLARWTRRTEPA